jgi:hypothetical protein
MRACPSLHVRTHFSSMDHFSVFVELSTTCTFSPDDPLPTCCRRREILQESAKGLVDSICVYRAGYIAEVVMSYHVSRMCSAILLLICIFMIQDDFWPYKICLYIHYKRDMFLSIDSQLRCNMYGFL